MKTSQSIAPSQSFKTTQTCNNLKNWVVKQGGFVDPRIQLTDAAPCGFRGLITTAPISEDEAARRPLIVVPADLYLTDELAEGVCLPLLTPPEPRSLASFLKGGLSATAPRAIELWTRTCSPVHRTALLLAHERAKKDASFFEPYIASLPESPPSGWAQTAAEQLIAAEQMSDIYGGGAASYMDRIRAARSAVDKQCDAMFRALGGPLGLTGPDEIRWALGQVLSRSFGGQDSCGLAPFIDLANHDGAASRPRGSSLGEVAEILSGRPVEIPPGEGDVSSSGSGFGAMNSDGGAAVEDADRECYCVYSERDGQPRSLASGDELYISYSHSYDSRNSEPNTAFQEGSAEAQRARERAMQLYLFYGFVLTSASSKKAKPEKAAAAEGAPGGIGIRQTAAK